MLRNWKMAYKVMLMPALAAVVFLVIVILTLQAVAKNEELLTEIEAGYFPAFDLTRDLAEDLAGIQGSLQNVAAAHDVAPSPGVLCTLTLPPCSATIFRVTAKPRPVPRNPLVEWNGLNSRL